MSVLASSARGALARLARGYRWRVAIIQRAKHLPEAPDQNLAMLLLGLGYL